MTTKITYVVSLVEWSHWDHIFSPTLDPILNWLDKEGNNNNFLYLVLRSGKLFRIDGSTTREGLFTIVVKLSAHKNMIKMQTTIFLILASNHRDK